MTSVCLVLLLLSIYLTLTVFRGRIMNPLMAYFPAYMLLLICYYLGLKRGVFQLEVDPAASWLLIGSMASVFLGTLVAIKAFQSNSDCAVSKTDTDAELDSVERLCKYGLGLFIIVVVYKYSVVHRVYGTIFPELSDIRIGYTEGDLKGEYGLANWAGQFLQAFLAMNIGPLLGARPTRRITILTIVFFFLEVLNDLTIGGAFNTFFILVLLSSCFVGSYEIIADRRLNWRHIRVLAISAIVVWFCALGIFETRQKGELLSIGAKPSDVILWYAGGDISTYQYFFDHPMPSAPFGRHLFGGLYGIADAISRMAGFPLLEARDPSDYIAFIPLPNNTSIYVSLIYADFGVLGTLIVSFAMGLLPTYLYFRALRLKRLVDVQYLVLVLLGVFMTIRVVITEAIYFWILIIFLALQNQLVNKRARQAYRAKMVVAQ